MRIDTKRFSFELPDRFKDIVGVAEKRGGVVFRLLWEEERSGVIVTIKALKRMPNRGDSELLGVIAGPDDEERLLIAVYGEEGACSEENEELYFRVRDRLYGVYKSITPAPGYSWRPTEE